MEFLRLFILLLLPVFMGAAWNHPAVEKGAECKACHEDGRTVKTPTAGHDKNWIRMHGQTIRRSGLKGDGTCQLCHTEATCTACHQQEMPRDHNAFWRLKGHGLAVGLDRSRCAVCHRGSDFCERCHAQNAPVDHTAAWGTPSNQHCLNCHYPLTSVGGQKCGVCHRDTPSHTAGTPNRPSNAIHTSGANCRSCHTPLRHPDNGMSCTSCHQ